jgi:ABC-type Fe3+ transport system substrate-binding protein
MSNDSPPGPAGNPSASPSFALLSPAERSRLLQSFQAGTKNLVANADYSIEMFTACVVGDPGNPVFLQALLGILRKKHPPKKSGGLASLFGGSKGGSLRKLVTAGQHRDVIKQGVEILKSNPYDTGALLAMADACGQLGFTPTRQVYLKAALDMHNLGRGQGMCMVYYPSGPLLEYLPARVKNVPTTAEELLAWTKANPNRFLYARPANSGPGRTFLMGLPYLLGDKDPKDPVNGWEKTWAYLKELGQNIEYYPTGTGATMKELGDGSRDMIVSTTGWDINPRVLGIVPKEAQIQTLKGFHWVSDAQYMFVPKGVSNEKLAVLLDLMSFTLQPVQQAFTYDEGYFYPGPAVKDVPLSMAPPESQKAIAEFGRPEYEALIANNPIETPLTPDKMVIAFRIWDEQIGTRRK